MRGASLGIVATLLASTASASTGGNVPVGTPVVIEAYTGPRPDEADARLRPMFDVFAEHGALYGAALTEELAPQSRAGISITDEELQRLGPDVDSAYNVLYEAEDETALQQAALRFKAAMKLADGATAVLASDDLQRRAALRAHVGLALAFRRLSEAVRQRKTNRDPAGADRYKLLAEQTMERAVLAFPGMEPDAGQGREAPEWWNTVRKRLRAGPTGTLVVEPGDEGAIVFIAEAFAGRGLTTKTDLPPATYRVYTERATTMGRVRTVEVRAREVTRVLLDWRFDSSLHTGATVWLSFESAAQHGKHRDAYAGRIAAMARRRYAIVVGLSSRPSGQYAFGLVVDSNGLYRGGAEFLLDDEDPDGTDETLRQLARLLLTPGGPTRRAPVPRIAPLDRTAALGPWIARPVVAVASRDHDRSIAGPIAAWASLGAMTATLGAGLYLSAIDEQCTNGAEQCPHRYTTKREAILGISSGIALSAATGYLWARHGPPPPRALRGSTSWIVGGVSLAAIAGGAALIAIDEPAWELYDGQPRAYAIHRPTLLAGSITASVGAFGLATALWGALADEPRIAPIVDVAHGGASFGLAGAF